MTKKHFEILARALASTKPIPWPAAGVHAYQVWSDTCAAVAEACWKFNKRFDPVRFVEACKRGGEIHEDAARKI